MNRVTALCQDDLTRSMGGMNVSEIRGRLHRYGLSTHGSRQVLRERLCQYMLRNNITIDQSSELRQSLRIDRWSLLNKFGQPFTDEILDNVYIDGEYKLDMFKALYEHSDNRRTFDFDGYSIETERMWKIMTELSDNPIMETELNMGDFTQFLQISRPTHSTFQAVEQMYNYSKQRPTDDNNDPVVNAALYDRFNYHASFILKYNIGYGYDITLYDDNIIRSYIPPSLASMMIDVQRHFGGLNEDIIKHYIISSLAMERDNSNIFEKYEWLADNMFDESMKFKNVIIPDAIDPQSYMEYWTDYVDTYNSLFNYDQDHIDYDHIGHDLETIDRLAQDDYEAMQSYLAQGDEMVVYRQEQQEQQRQQEQQEQQHQQRQQREQTSERFRQAASLTNTATSIVSEQTSHHDACTILRTKMTEFMTRIFDASETYCRKEIHEKICTRGGQVIKSPLISLFQEIDMRYPFSNQITYKIKWGPEIDNRYYFILVSSLAADLDRDVKFSLDSQSGDVAIDAGGVSRAVYSKAGSYIKSIMKKENGVYYFQKGMPKNSIKHIANCIAVAMRNGYVLGVPFSYGILYAIKNRSNFLGTSYRPNVPLHQLVALYRMDDANQLMTLVRAIVNEESIDTSVEYYEDNIHFLPKTQTGEPISITMETRLEWLKRALFHKLFSKYVDKLLYYIDLESDSLDMDNYIVESPLSDLSKVLGAQITKESIKNLVITGETELLHHMNRYISEASVERLEQLLDFATGSHDPHTSINLDRSQSAETLPVAHTCSNTIEMRPRSSYRNFKRDLEISLDNYAGSFAMI